MRPTTAANALIAFACICFNVNAFSATLNLSVASTANEQGLITALAERFQEKHPEHQVVISEVGALVALDRARNNQADAILTHHPASELVFMDDGLGLSRTLIMYNQFAILGPNSDPLGISARGQTNRSAPPARSQRSGFLCPGRTIRHLSAICGTNENRQSATGLAWLSVNGFQLKDYGPRCCKVQCLCVCRPGHLFFLAGSHIRQHIPAVQRP